MNSLKINAAMALTLIFWSSALIGIRIGLTTYSPGALALLRFLVASLCMAIFYSRISEKKKMLWSERLQLLLIGVAGIGIYNISLNYGEITVSASIAGFVISLMPIFTIILSVIFLKERLNLFMWIGIVISLMGLFLILEGEHSATTINSSVLAILLAALMGGTYSVTQKRYLRHYHPIAITAWIIWGGTLMLLLFLPQLCREIKTANYAGTLAAIYMGIFPAALAYVAWCYILNYWPVSKASLYLYALPILSTLEAFILLHEKPSLLSLSGGILTLFGAFLASWTPSLGHSESKSWN